MNNGESRLYLRHSFCTSADVIDFQGSEVLSISVQFRHVSPSGIRGVCAQIRISYITCAVILTHHQPKNQFRLYSHVSEILCICSIYMNWFINIAAEPRRHIDLSQLAASRCQTINNIVQLMCEILFSTMFLAVYLFRRSYQIGRYPEPENAQGKYEKISTLMFQR